MFPAFFDVFNAEQISQSQIEEALSLECIKNAFLVAIKIQNIEIAKFLLNFSEKLQIVFDCKLFMESLKFAIENEFFEIYDLLKNCNIILLDNEKIKILEYCGNECLCELFMFILKSFRGNILKLCVGDAIKELSEVFINFFDSLTLTKNAKRLAMCSTSRELMIQEVIEELFRDEESTKMFIEKSTIFLAVTAHGLESNLKYLLGKMEKNLSNEQIRQLLFENYTWFNLSLSMNTNLSSVKILWDFYTNIFTPEDLSKLIIQLEGFDNLLQFTVWNDQPLEIIEFLWKNVQNVITDGDEIKNYLLAKNKFCSNILNLSTATAKQNCFEFLFEKIYCTFLEPKEFIFETSNCDYFYQSLICKNSLPILKYATEQLKKRLSDAEFKDFIKTKSLNGLNVFHYAAMKRNNEEMLKFLACLIESELGIEEFRKMLSESDEEDFLPLHIAIKRNNFSIFVKIYEKKFSKAEFKEFLKYKNLMSLSQISYDAAENLAIKNVLRKYSDPIVGYFLEFCELTDNLMPNYWKKIEEKTEVLKFLITDRCFNIFHYAAEFTRHPKLLACILSKIKLSVQDDDSEFKKILLLKNTQGKNALALSTTLETSSDVFLYLFEKIYCNYFNLEEFIYECDNAGNNLFQNLAKKGTESMLKFVSNKLKEKLPLAEYKKYLKLKNEARQNFLHVAAKFNKSIKSVNFLFNLIEKERAKKMLLETDENDLLPLHLAVANNEVDIFETLQKLYMENVPESIFFIYKMEEKYTGKDIYHLSDVSSMQKAVQEMSFRTTITKISDEEFSKRISELTNNQFEFRF